MCLLEARVGVLALLDEECALPKGSEAAYVDKLNKRFCKLQSYAVPPARGGAAKAARAPADPSRPPSAGDVRTLYTPG